jgi:hypothetical protein
MKSIQDLAANGRRFCVVEARAKSPFEGLENVLRTQQRFTTRSEAMDDGANAQPV